MIAIETVDAMRYYREQSAAAMLAAEETAKRYLAGQATYEDYAARCQRVRDVQDAWAKSVGIKSR